LTFQCRNFLTAKEEAAAAAVVALERERGVTKGRDVGGGTGPAVGDATSFDEESEISDSDEDLEMERALARLGRSKKNSNKVKALDSGPPLPSIRPVICPSKFFIPEEEEEGGGRMATSVVYPSSLNFQIKKEENKLLINK
jgi:hypothetical protein